MATFCKITKRDNPAKLAAMAVKHHELLTEALAIAQRKSESAPQIIQEILATGTVEGLASSLNARASAVSYRAEKYKRTWHTLIPWQNLEHTTADYEADSMIDTVKEYLRMTETDSWPTPPVDQPSPKKKR